jgi:hypothetical protein
VKIEHESLNKPVNFFYLSVHFADHYSYLARLDVHEYYVFHEIFWRDALCHPMPSDPEKLAAMIGSPVDSVVSVFAKLGHKLDTATAALHHHDVVSAKKAAIQEAGKNAEKGRRGGLVTQQRRRDKSKLIGVKS